MKKTLSLQAVLREAGGLLSDDPAIHIPVELIPINPTPSTRVSPGLTPPC